MATLKVVVAMAANSRGIGRDGCMPWRLRNELRYFKEITCATSSPGAVNAVVMGRKTWDSLPASAKPLPGRLNVVLSRSLEDAQALPSGVVLTSSLDDAVASASAAQAESIFVIGGAAVYQEALARPDCAAVFLTQVYGDIGAPCDVFFPDMGAAFRCRGTPASAPAGRQREGDLEYEFLLYEREAPVESPAQTSSPNPAEQVHEERQYLELIQQVLERGNRKGDRTGTGTLSTFGATMRFSLREGVLPLLTTKRVFWRGVAEELLWFISGSTDARVLREKGIHIWDGNGSREFLDKLGLTEREEFDLGPVYGFQWRHFGAEYKTMHEDYTGQGVDQLAKLVETIKTNPNDRRMILSAWNPAAFHLMALPPCHMFAQFYVSNGELSCQMYQRSADMGLGVPFNIASYALLTHLLAHCTGLRAGEFIHVIGDCHVYSNHVEPLREQLEREPRPFPTLKINTTNTDIDGFTFDDLEVVGYDPHKPIKMKMAV